ncbi:glycosyltransferase 87 family protein [Nigerium massiliense]|uniref:glycosyltransferase 87 family protein n=1 Tax=Nigerium massiliense TaxID=1522317 RepID=UPI00058DB3C6|nr:glycosyltransferase 87 family protein [Nigerium massiliense]
MNRAVWARAARGLAWLLLPLAAAIWVAAVQIAGGSIDPWRPAMIDLDVYRRAAGDLLAGRDFYATPDGQLPWIYPAFAALLSLPLGLIPLKTAQVFWLLLNVVALWAILGRLGLSGWRNAMATTLCVLVVEPVRETLGFGQLGILLVAAAWLDSAPGPRLLRRRLLPEGWLVGVATAVKLTPAVVAAYNFFAGRRKPGLVAFFTFCAASLLALLVLPGASMAYWRGLLSGDSGINTGIIFKTNQSAMGLWARLFGELNRGGLVLSAVVLVLGIAGAVAMHRAGEVSLAICLAGYTSLLASPISWSHHYVWVVPLTVVLLRGTHLPAPLRLFGLIYCLWTIEAPFKKLPGGDGAELAYTPVFQFIANAGIVAGVVFLAMGLGYGLGMARRGGMRDRSAGVLQ